MKRKVSLEEISDGRLYGRTDMVRAGCGGCHGCSECCSGMGNSVILDPYDVFRLTARLKEGFEALMQEKLELNVVDGIILPNLKMGGSKETCAFLDGEGRCSIHDARPGICRLFPLGRYYETEDGTDAQGNAGKKRTFRYFLQVHECPLPNKTKVKVEKWIDTPQIVRYEKFINDWHYLLEDVQGRIGEGTDEDTVRNLNLLLLKLFYIRPYDTEKDFYPQFEERLRFFCEAADLELP